MGERITFSVITIALILLVVCLATDFGAQRIESEWLEQDYRVLLEIVEEIQSEREKETKSIRMQVLRLKTLCDAIEFGHVGNPEPIPKLNYKKR